MACVVTCVCVQVYEKGVAQFTFPAVMELWVVYLTKFVRRYVRSVSFRVRCSR